MKQKSWLLFLCVLPTLLQAQVRLSAKAVKQGEKTYLLTINLILENGFHLYAPNEKENIEGPKITFINAKVRPFVLTGKTKSLKDPVFEGKTMNIYTGSVEFNTAINIEGNIPSTLNGTLSGFAAKEQEFLTIEEKFSVQLEGVTENKTNSLRIPSIDLQHPLNDTATTSDHSALSVFFLGLFGGLLALLTPCVFPMIPVTVSFFTTKATSKKQGIKNGILYGLFILLIYLCASLPFHLIKNMRPELLNNIATSAPLNIFFFLVFLFFAISFFGLFDLSLPSSFATRAGKKSGIFFMALTLCIVSFSCTGPILGSLLVGSLSGGAWLLTAGLAGFGVALALPFAIFAIFPRVLQKLPRSGQWMVTVKKTLAFIELALALKFLSNADLVMHWGILKREVFIVIWLLIGLALTFYLVFQGKWIFGVISFLFVLYLSTGLFGGSLSYLSGFPPPMSYSFYLKNGETVKADVINDYDTALVLAKKQNKKLLIDFTGWACVNCRKMEEQVWTEPEVADYIKQNFVLVSLYVDDKKLLPVEQRNDSITTIGDRFAKFQVLNFGQASQPLYAVLNGEQQLMTTPKAYEPDAMKFLDWLKKAEQ